MTPSSLPAPACTCGRLRRATRALTQLYDDLMAPSGLRVTQFSLLRTLATHGTARMSDLVAITTGLDARTREVALTPAGARAIRSAAPHWKRAQAQVVARIGRTKLDALVATLADVEQLHPDPGGNDH